MTTTAKPHGHASRIATLRLRIGVGLVILSWMPFPQLYIWIAGLSGEAADKARTIGWTIEFIVGLIGLGFAGAAAKTVVKHVGWRKLPRALWTMFRTGAVPQAEPVPEPIQPA